MDTRGARACKVGVVLSLLLLCWSANLVWSQTGWESATGSPKFFDAAWIAHPTATTLDYAVLHFRKAVEVVQLPASLNVHVSADQRYKLYVNGELISLGPTRGDLLHWRYETIDIAPYLRAGSNVIGATVWNFGKYTPAAQISLSTAFLLQPDEEALSTHPWAEALTTDASWQVHHNLAYSPEPNHELTRSTYAVVGPTDIVEAARYPWGWQTARDTAEWVLAKAGRRAKGYGGGTDGGRYLVPRQQAAQRSDTVSWGVVVRKATSLNGGGEKRSPIREGGLPDITVPANTALKLLIDAGSITTGYPSFTASGGSGASIEIGYAEALLDDEGNKGHRDSIKGKSLIGFTDRYLLDGGGQRNFEPLWWRTWRYIEVSVSTQDEAVTLSNFAARLTGYPLTQRASFQTSQPWLEDVWRTGWQTQLQCAHETFVDCPYYEQLQYVGDTRVQALVTLYNSGDAALMRRALLDFDASQLPGGLTQSRYPSDRLQVIPPYSLAWVAMLYDYYLHVGEEDLVRSLLPGVERILAWHAERLNANHLLGRTRWWNFVDWADDWPWNSELRVGGVPPQDVDGNSTILSLQYAYTLGLAAKLYTMLGNEPRADEHTQQGLRILGAVRELAIAENGTVLDLPEGSTASQHAQAMHTLSKAVLTNAVSTSELYAKLMKPGLTQATLYYRFYLAEALASSGQGDDYLKLLDPWKTMLGLGLSTFAEKPEPTRSDCHAWSASPNYHLLSLVAGIRPVAPGFSQVRLSPALGNLPWVETTMPLPQGMLSVRYDRQAGGGLEAVVSLPPGVGGTIVWNGVERSLTAGEQRVEFE